MIANFPLEDILASRDNEALQSENSAIIATTRADHAPETRCESCGGSGNALDWFYFESPAYTWERLCGRAGVIALCNSDHSQVAFYVTVIN